MQKVKDMKTHYQFGLFLLAVSLATWVAPVSSNVKVYTFSIVPQQSARKTAKTWGPLLKYITQKTGVKLQLRTNKTIPEFEAKLKTENYDFSYMNPYHYTHFHDLANYNAVAKAKDKKIKGIMVVGKNSSIRSLADLDGQELAFPSPAAFAASILPRAYMKQQGIKFTPKYVLSHDSVYRNVAKNRFASGGGVVRTFKNLDNKVSSDLRILWKTKGYTPHAIAAHSRVPDGVISKVLEALKNLHDSDKGKKLLKSIKLKGFVEAKNSDWDDVRELNIDKL